MNEQTLKPYVNKTLKPYVNTEITICVFYKGTSNILAYITGHLRQVDNKTYFLQDDLNFIRFCEGKYTILHVTKLDAIPNVIGLELKNE